MPAPIVLRNLLPETKKPASLPPGQPLIATRADLRDGMRQAGPDAPTFTLSSSSTSITATITQGNGATSYEIRVDSGAAVSGLTVSGLTVEQMYSVQVRGINSDGTAGPWSTAVNKATSSQPTGVIFQDNFDAQPDYHNEMYAPEVTEQGPETGITVPVGWDAVYQSGSFKRPSLEILASNSDKTRTGSGKSFVGWREFEEGGRFNSSNTLYKIIPGPDGDGIQQLYAEFWVAFSENWSSEENLSKMFRASSWDVSGSIFQGASGGDNGPMLYWDHQNSVNYGIFNNLAIRGGPHGENYNIDWPSGIPAGSTNFTGDMLQQLPDKVNGGLIPVGPIVQHEQVFGPKGAQSWTKVAFFMKMNSAPGVEDGVYMQWFDDHLVLKTEALSWVLPNTANKMVKWNVVAIGGNDRWVASQWTDADQREEWYAIDDFLVSHDIPVGLETSV